MLNYIDGDVINLYAIWSANSYSIAFYSRGSNDVFTSINDVKADEVVSIPNHKPSLAGYTFIGWDINPTTITPKFFADADNKVTNLATSHSDLVILYAIYIPNNYTIIFDANGGRGAPSPINCAYDRPKSVPNVISQKDKMVFIGWNDNKNSTIEKYRVGDSLKGLTTNPSITLYAIYVYVTFRIRYYGGSDVSNIPSDSSLISYNQDSYLMTDITPTKSGYLFIGWSKNSDSNASVDYTNNYKLERVDIHELYDLSENKVVTLYSVFKKIYEFKLDYYEPDDTGAVVKFSDDVVDSYGVTHKKDEVLKYYQTANKIYYFDKGIKIK